MDNEHATDKPGPLNYEPSTSGNWSPWSDLHRRIRVYETRPVAAEAQRQNCVHGRNRTCDLHIRTVAL